MRTRIFSRLIPIGRLPAAIVLAGTLCASARGQADNNASPLTQAAQELNNNMQRLLQQGALPGGGGFGSGGNGDAGAGFSAGPGMMMAGPTFDLEVSGGRIVKSLGESNGPVATVGNLVSVLQEKVTNFNAIQAAGVADVPLNNFKLRDVNVVTVLNILPSITDNKAQARTLVGARGLRGLRGGQGGPGGPIGVGPGMQAGAVYMLELIPPVQPINNAGGGGSGDAAPAASDAPTRQMAVFNINGYLAYLAGRGEKDAPAISDELGHVNGLIGDSLQRLNQRPVQKGEFDFEFHAGTGLVIVIGSPQALDVATKIINALPGNEDNPALELQRRLKAAADLRTDDYNRVLQTIQSLQNSYSNQPGSVAPVPAPNGGQ